MKASDFNKLILPIQQNIFRLSRRLLVSSDSAEDATQDVLLKLWNKKDSLDDIKNIEAFAMTMTKNHCLDQLKLKSSQNLRLVHSNFENDQADPHHQMVLHLREIEGYEYDKICEILDMKPTAVRVTLSRARKTLVEQLSKQNSYEKRNYN